MHTITLCACSYCILILKWLHLIISQENNNLNTHTPGDLGRKQKTDTALLF